MGLFENTGHRVSSIQKINQSIFSFRSVGCHGSISAIMDMREVITECCCTVISYECSHLHKHEGSVAELLDKFTERTRISLGSESFSNQDAGSVKWLLDIELKALYIKLDTVLPFIKYE